MKTRSSTNIFLTLLVAATLPLLSAQSPATPQGQSIAAPEPPKMPPPLATGPAPDLDLVFSAQVAGYVEPCG